MSEFGPSASDAVVLSATRRRGWWSSLLLALVTFASGIVVGSGATTLVIRHYARENILQPEKARQRLFSWMRWKLELTDSQAATVHEILRRRQAAVMAIRRDVQPKVEAELDRLEMEVAEVLNPEQRAVWRARVGHLRKQWIPPLPPLRSGLSAEHPSETAPR